MKRIVVNLCFLPLLSVLLSFTAASGAERQKIIVGGDHDNPPYEFLLNGRPTGFNIELMQAVAEATGLEVEFRLGPWDEVRRELEQGKIDVLAGMYYSAERSRLFDFSVPHTMVTSGLFVRQGSPITSFADLKGKEVIVQKGDVIHDLLKQKDITPHLVALKDPADVLRLLSSGSHDCALMPSRFQGEYFAKKLKLSNIDVSNAGLPQLRYCFALRKGNRDLQYRLDEGLNILRITGKYRNIYEKWFGTYEKRRMWETLRYYAAALALVVAFLAASLVWLRFLRRQVRKKTAELRESEEKFRVLAETSPAGICLYQGERIVYVNAAGARLFGYPERECLEMRFWDWVHDDFKELVRERGMARQRGESVPVQYECRHVTKSGQDKWVLISAGPIEFKGKPAGLVTFFDITERKCMEDELQHAYDGLEKKVRERTAELAHAAATLGESETASRQLAAELGQKQNLLRTLIDSIPDLIFYKDLKGGYLGCNKAFAAFAGVGEKDLVGRTDLDLFPRETAALFQEMDRTMLAGGVARRNEEWIDYPDGRHVLLETLKTPFRNHDGEVLGLIGISRDITERKRMEDELRDSKEKYRSIVEAYDGFIYICSEDLRMEFMNRKLLERTGYDALGEFCYKVLHDRDSMCPWCVNDRVFGGESLHWEMLSPKDGRWYYVVNVPIFNANGSISKHSVITDIHDLKMTEEQLRQQKQQLEELNDTLEKRVQEEVAKNREKDIVLIQQNRQAALGELLDHIAHQWKQPLNAISFIVQDLETTWSCGELTEEYIKGSVRQTFAQVDHMAQTVQVFRDFYRPEKEKTVFRLKDSIETAIKFISTAMKFHSVTVELELDPELSAIGFHKEYAQVLLNILTNAIDCFKEIKVEKPTVKVRSFADGGKAVVTLTDNAGGIPETIIGKIFELYFTTREAKGGTGVGLYMSKNIIEKNMAGKLEAANTGDGAQFRIELDRAY